MSLSLLQRQYIIDTINRQMDEHNILQMLLEEQETGHQRRVSQLEEQETEHQRRVSQLEEQIHQRDTYIKNLSQNLEQIREQTASWKYKCNNLKQWRKEDKTLFSQNQEETTSRNLEQIRQRDNEHQERVSQLEEQIRQRETECQTKVSQLEEQIRQRETEHQKQIRQRETECQEKVSQLKEQIRQRETECQKKVSRLEEQIRQRDTEILKVSNGKKSLSQDLEETRNQLFSKMDEHNDKASAWKVKYDTLERKATQDQKQSVEQLKAVKSQLEKQKTECQTKVSQLEEQIRQRETECQTKVSQLEEQIRQMDTKIKGLIDDKLSLSQDLGEKTIQLVSKVGNLTEKERVWEIKYCALEKRLKIAEDLAEQVQNKETGYQRKVSELEEQIRQWDTIRTGKASFSQDLKEPRIQQLKDELCSKENAYNALEDKLSKDLIQMKQDCDRNIERLEEQFRKDMAEKQANWDIREQRLQDERTELEEVCLREKGKRRITLFNRDLGDRKSALETMKYRRRNEMAKH